MMDRLPWEIVETLPSTDAALIDHWEQQVTNAKTPGQRVHALVGRALSLYWAVPEGLSELSWQEVRELRYRDIDEAEQIARQSDNSELLATALLGGLYALWDANGPLERGPVVSELTELFSDVVDEELRFRIREWKVLAHFDSADLDSAQQEMKRFSEEANRTDLTLFRRRAELWNGTLAMLEGRVDKAIQINQHAISSTAEFVGSPFSFQNVAINLAIEQFFHRTLGDAIDSIRSIRASSPRVASAWDTGLAFALSECDQLDEATELYDSLAINNFEQVDRDLNWLVTIQLLGLVAVRLEDPGRCRNVLALMRPFEELDTTHGSGYASYGPVARVLGSLAAVAGDHESAERWFAFVLQHRPPGPWRSLTLLNRAQARASLKPEQAIEDANAAATELESFGLSAWAIVARDLRQGLQLQGHGGPAARREANLWTMSHPSGKAVVRHSKGMDYLTQLLARPGKPIDVTQLDTEISAAIPTTATTTSSIDAEARGSYRQRAASLQAAGELSPQESEELQHLLKELAGSVYVHSSSAEIERARVRVTKAIRRSIQLIGEQSPALGTHLETSVETGRRCLYSPPRGAAWEIREI